MSLSRKSPKRIAKNKKKKAEQSDKPLRRLGRYLFDSETYLATKAERKAKKEIKKNKLKVTGSADTPGAARAKAAAKVRIDAGRNTVTGKKKGVKKKKKITTWRDME